MKQFITSPVYGLTLGLGLFAVAMGLGGCTTARIPATSLEVPLPNIPLPAVLRGENDLRSRPRDKAFQILHERMEREYAYGSLKAVDWDGLYDRVSPDVAAAEAEKDRTEWYLALRRYVYSIPDGNVQLDPNEVLRYEAEGASVGLALTQLADGSVIVCGLVPEGPAEDAGIEWGATVTNWNEKPITEALARTSIFWADTPPAASYTRLQQQLTWLPRGGVGDSCRITFQNPGVDTAETVTLERVADDYATLALGRPLWMPVELFSSPVERKVLDGGYQYIRIAAFAPTLSTPFPVRDFRNAVVAGINGEAPGLVIDLRGTQGGDSTVVPKMLTSFVTESTFYQTPAIWDTELETFLVETESTILIEPQLPAYEGPIVVLVDSYTMGPAESFVRFLTTLDNVQVFGTSGTYGSPGTPNTELTVPGGYVVMYPTERPVDENGVILGVADSTGAGSVACDETFVMTREHARALFEAKEDRILDAALALLIATNNP